MRRFAWVALAVSLPAIACVVETEPAPRRPLLRDNLKAYASATASASAPRPVVSAVPPPAPPPDAFRACETGADCVAAPPNGCCQDGRNVALNKGLLDAYRSTFHCPQDHPVCPADRVLDRRLAQCDGATRLCVLSDAP